MLQGQQGLIKNLSTVHCRMRQDRLESKTTEHFERELSLTSHVSKYPVPTWWCHLERQQNRRWEVWLLAWSLE